MGAIVGMTDAACGTADAGRFGEKHPRFGGDRPVGLGGGAFVAGAALMGVWVPTLPMVLGG